MTEPREEHIERILHSKVEDLSELADLVEDESIDPEDMGLLK